MKDNGYTLVELVVSMLITAIVITIVISFMSANSKSYDYVSDNLNLQMEAQTVMNQIGDIILEANWIELDDINTTEKAIIIYNSGGADVVLFNKTLGQLFLIEDVSDSVLANLSAITYTEEDNLMATNVSDININPSDEDSIRKYNQICLSVDFTDAGQTGHVERNVSFRNHLVKP